MSILIKYIADYAMWLYILLAFVALILLRLMGQASRERSRSIFALEREGATARLVRSIIYLLLIILLAVGIFYVSNTLIEQVPLPDVTPTPTAVVELPPTPTTPPLLPTPTPTTTPLPRPTAIPQTIDTPATPEAAVNPGVPANCPNSNARITQPGDSATVSGFIQIFGSANVEDLDYYKIEFLAPGSDWNFIQSYNVPVADGLLATWNTDTVPPGQYGFRLVVVDKTGNYPEPCRITLNIQR